MGNVEIASPMFRRDVFGRFDFLIKMQIHLGEVATSPARPSLNLPSPLPEKHEAADRFVMQAYTPLIGPSQRMGIEMSNPPNK
jgi:hypothetical protein